MSNSPWLRRLKYYGIGFGIGMIFVFFFFQNRGCSWLPGNRVKNSILDRLVVVSDSTTNELKKRGISDDFIISALNDGDVDFNGSQKHGDSKVYVIEKDGERLNFTLPYESFLTEVTLDADSKDAATSTTGQGRIIHFPLDENLVYPDSNSVVTCQQDVLGLINPKDILKLLKEDGKVDFSKTDLNIRPKPEQYLIFKKDDKEIGIKAIWYKNKVNVTSFEIPFETDCQ